MCFQASTLCKVLSSFKGKIGKMCFFIFKRIYFFDFLLTRETKEFPLLIAKVDLCF